LVVPKTNSAESIQFVERLVSLAEQRCGRAAGSVLLLPLIEQPEAIGNAFAIAKATPRIAGIAFGHGDFSLAMGIKAAPSTEGVVFHARCQVVMAAKAAGITPIDNVFLDIPNIEGLAVETRQGKSGGAGECDLHSHSGRSGLCPRVSRCIRTGGCRREGRCGLPWPHD
jgi:citrate lyase subunit beta / citryl-CoA lyase